MRKQTYTSANTSLKQVPALFKRLNIDENTVILDYGCGKYDLAKEYVESKGGKYFGFDPYNRTEEENIRAMQCKPTIITCANVLNVIDNTETIYEIIQTIASFKVPTFFSVYEGNRTNKGKHTKNNCYQRNEKAIEYKPRLEHFFPYVKRTSNIFYCDFPNE